jgi:nitrogenase-stabilizing/protective protein
MFVDVPLRDPMGPAQEEGGSAPPASRDTLADLKRAASAEEFFALLGVAYDTRVLDVARLHILKRMGEYLGRESFDGMAANVAAERCKAVLERAYADFAASSPLQQRVFKVLKQAVAPQPPEPAQFVSFDTLLE